MFEGWQEREERGTHTLESRVSRNSLWAVFTVRETEVRALILPFNSLLRKVSAGSASEPVVDPEPVESELVDPELVESELVDPELVESEPVDPEPVESEPVEWEY